MTLNTPDWIQEIKQALTRQPELSGAAIGALDLLELEVKELREANRVMFEIITDAGEILQRGIHNGKRDHRQAIHRALKRLREVE